MVVRNVLEPMALSLRQHPEQKQRLVMQELALVKACAATTACAAAATTAPTKAVAAATPTTLPETGILDLPGVAAFGGGLLLSIVGILLAL